MRVAFLFACWSIFASGCAQLHQVHIGEIHQEEGDLAPFELKVSETGVDLHEATSIAQGLTHDHKAKSAMRDIETIIALFQYGPRTGNLVYSETYADELAEKLRTQCPSGKMTGLISIRETRKYPVISGEIVKIKGYCVLPRKDNVKL